MNDSDDEEYETHARTWIGFTLFMKWSVIFVVVILAGMAAFLT